MKLSTNFVKDYIDIDVDVKTLAEDMTKAGNEYDSAEKLVNATNLVIGEIKSCKPHPDSDHLHLCKVDVGTEILDIVCGAPNAREGIKVIVALPGAELPGGVKIKSGVIRGEQSNGMMCALYEIGIDKKYLSEEDKNGICELPQDAVPGEDPIAFLGLDDEVIDFDLTANRGDLLSILGMAYEIGAIYNKKLKKELDMSHKENGKDVNESLKVDVQTDNCKLFLAKRAENIQIKESPAFIKNRLIASGIRPINNVVDISNYVMLEVGQPLHFYDSDFLGNKLIVRMANKDEKLTTLDNIERTLNENDIVIAKEDGAIGLAGVMGGLTTEVEEATKNITIESAIFDPVLVRKTSNKILRSEASNRFEKGIAINSTYMAIERACNLLEKYANATIITGTVVYDKTKTENNLLSDRNIKIKYKDINDVLGTNISKEEILDVFKRLDFEIDYSDDEEANVCVPRRRLDISIKEDLIEEVGRIYGVDNIQGKLPKLEMKQGNYDKTGRAIRNKMIDLGLNETLSYILINDKEVHKFTTDEFEELKLLDPITVDRNTLRYSMIPSLYKIYEYNYARNQKDVSIFEIGKGFFKKGEIYGEENKLCVLMSGIYSLGIEKKQVDFYILKGIAEELLDYLGYENRYSFVMPKNIPNEFHPGQTAEINVNNDIVGIIGRVHPEVTSEKVFVMEINLDKLLSKKVGGMKYKEISKYPTIKKDLSLIIDKNKTSYEIEKELKKAAGKLLTNIEVFDLYTGKGIDKDKKSIAYSLSFGANDRTLTDEEINEVLNKIIETAQNKLHAELRK